MSQHNNGPEPEHHDHPETHESDHGDQHDRHHEHGGGVHDDHGGHDHHTDSIEIKVNGRPVILHGKRVDGAQIKAAAIAQGVAIQQNFVLQEELPNGTSKIIGDADEVHLRPHLRFTAIRPDDNS